MESNTPGNPYRVHTSPGPPRVPAQKQRSGGCAWMAMCVVLAGLLSITWLGILASSGGGFAMTGPNRLDLWNEVLVEDNGSEDRVVIIQLRGLISSLTAGGGGPTMVQSIKDQLTLAQADDSIKGVILKIGSPGGEVLASDDIYRALKSFQEESGKPIVATMSGLAASGGYYVAAPCQWIVANELTITGSIGVIMHSYNYRGLMDKLGIKPLTFKTGKFKDMLSGDKAEDEILPEAHAMVQTMIDETFERFKTVISEGRTWSQEQNQGDGQALAEDWEDYADGRILSGRQAYELGFVDELGTFDQAQSRIAQLLDTPAVNLIQFEEPFSFGSIFSLMGNAGKTTVEVELGPELPKLQAGRLYFLSPQFIH